MTMAAEIAETLKAARATVEKGWCQYAYRVGDDACALGAILRASKPSRGRSRAIDVLREVTGRPITDWNDTEGRTQAEVLAAFDKAIALAESDQ